MKQITIAGVGALGSHVVQFIRNFNANIKVIDLDRIEQKNTKSQFHAKNSTGKSKSQSLAQLMQFLFNLKMEAVPHKLTNDNINQLLKGSDLIIDCFDNYESRNIIQQYSKQNKIACLHGCLAANGEFGRVVWTEKMVIDKEAEAGAATCHNGDFLPFIATVSALLARSAQDFLEKNIKVGYEVTPGNIWQTK